MFRVETWPDYVRRVVGKATQQQIEDRTGIPASNVGRWLRGEPVQPKADSVVAFARAYKQSPVEALVAAGYLTIEEVDVQRRYKTALSEYETAELFEELRRRMGG